MKHMMVDLETLATSVDAHILSIGAVVFDPTEMTGLEGLVNPPSFRLTMNSEGQPGRHIDPATVRWWFEQDQAARDVLLRVQSRLSLSTALEAMRRVYKENGCAAVWSNGSNFDLSILDHAYRTTMGGRPPWHYRDVRDTRTLWAVLPPAYPDNPCKHDPLWDAACQAQAVQSSLLRLSVL